MRFDRRHLVFGSLGALLSTTARGVESSGSQGFPAVEKTEPGGLAIRDDLGARVVLKSPIKRVVAFNRYNAEFVRAVAGSAAIVGLDVNAGRDPAYWPHLHAVRVGQGQNSPNFEAIVAVKPDAVFFPRNSNWTDARQILTPFDIPTVVLTGWDVLKHEANVDLLGALFQREDNAAKLNAFYRHYRDLLATRLGQVQRKRVYFEEVADYRTVLPGSGWHDMIELAGGINIFGDIDGPNQPTARGNIQSFAINPEEILTRRPPDMIVKLQPGQYEPHTKSFSAGVLRSIADRPGFGSLAAVKNGQAFSISYYLAGACSKIVGAVQLAKWLHPDPLADIDPGEAMRIWLEDFQHVPYPGGYWMSLAQLRQ